MSGKRPKSRPRRRWLILSMAVGLIVALLAVEALIVVWAVIVFRPLPPVRLEVGPETTYLTGPLHPDGTVDYAAALNERMSEGVTAENNAAVILLRAAGPGFLDDHPGVREALNAALGIEPLPADGPYFIKAETYLATATDLPPAPAPAPAPADEAGAGAEATGKMPVPPLGAEIEDEEEAESPEGGPPEAEPLESGRAGTEASGPSPEAAAMAEHFERLFRSPWRADDEPHAAEWLALNQAPLDRLHTIGPEHRWFWPVIIEPGDDKLMSALLPHLNLARGMARARAARAALRIGEGDLEAAWADILTLHRLADLMVQEPPLISRLVGDAIGSRLAAPATMMLLEAGPSPALLSRVHGDLADLRAHPPFVRVLDYERFMGLDAVQSIIRRPAEPSSGPERWLDSLPIDIEIISADVNLVLSRINHWYDAYEAALAEPDPRKRLDRVEEVYHRIEQTRPFGGDLSESERNREFIRFLLRRLTSSSSESREQISEMIAGLFANILIPSLDHAVRIDLLSDAIVIQARTAVALRLYKQRHGRYPDSLDALAPELLPGPPLDPFTGGPLRYRREGEGYVLWSIGPDLTDDDAAIPYEPGTTKPDEAFDIVHRVSR